MQPGIDRGIRTAGHGIRGDAIGGNESADHQCIRLAGATCEYGDTDCLGRPAPARHGVEIRGGRAYGGLLGELDASPPWTVVDDDRAQCSQAVGAQARERTQPQDRQSEDM
jgi:cation diffusion facilitator CzcD-associated flavoprotein CzcO